MTNEIKKGYNFEDANARKMFFQRREREIAELRKKDPKLNWLLKRTEEGQFDVSAEDLLTEHNLPRPTLSFRKQLREGFQDRVDATLVNDSGEITLLRGDHPGLSNRGIYSYPYVRWGMLLDQFLEADGDSEPTNHWNFRAQTKLEQYMWQHSNGGYEPFVSTTPNHRIARKHPDYEENSGSIYVIRVPVDRVIPNYASVVSGGSREDEYLITDYVLPENIIAELDPRKHNHVDPRDFID